jgi:hypothetical protein
VGSRRGLSARHQPQIWDGERLNVVPNGFEIPERFRQAFIVRNAKIFMQAARSKVSVNDANGLVNLRGEGRAGARAD